MAKTENLSTQSLSALRSRKTVLLKHISIPPNFIRASYVKQLVTCGKATCRCKRGFKHGPFHYLVQCLGVGKVRKFLLKTPEQQRLARESIAAHAEFQERLAELSLINTELLRRGELETGSEN